KNQNPRTFPPSSTSLRVELPSAPSFPRLAGIFRANVYGRYVRNILRMTAEQDRLRLATCSRVFAKSASLVPEKCKHPASRRESFGVPDARIQLFLLRAFFSQTTLSIHTPPLLVGSVPTLAPLLPVSVPSSCAEA